MAKNEPQPLPPFANEDEEREFWAHANTLEYTEEVPDSPSLRYVGPPRDRHRGKGVLLRLDPDAIDRLKAVARTKGTGYQTLIRMWVLEHLRQEAS